MLCIWDMVGVGVVGEARGGCWRWEIWLELREDLEIAGGVCFCLC